MRAFAHKTLAESQFDSGELPLVFPTSPKPSRPAQRAEELAAFHEFGQPTRLSIHFLLALPSKSREAHIFRVNVESDKTLNSAPAGSYRRVSDSNERVEHHRICITAVNPDTVHCQFDRKSCRVRTLFGPVHDRLVGYEPVVASTSQIAAF